MNAYWEWGYETIFMFFGVKWILFWIIWIFDILNLLAEYKEDRKIFYGVVSNGMSMDIQGYDEVLATNISYLEISLEALEIQWFDKGENGYNTVYELIENVEHRDKINITSTIFDDNGADLLSMFACILEIRSW